MGRLFNRERKLQISELFKFDNKNAKVELFTHDRKTLSAENRFLGVNEHVVLTADTTLTSADNGKTFYLDAAAGFDVTLPAPFLGMRMRFVVRTAPTSNGYDIATNGGDDIMKGMVHEANSATGATDQNADNLNFAANVALAGDYVEVESDGTSVFFRGMVQANNGLVASTT